MKLCSRLLIVFGRNFCEKESNKFGEMCTARLFSQGVDLFALKFYLYGVVPINRSGVRKLKALGYPMMKTASICVPSF